MFTRNKKTISLIPVTLITFSSIVGTAHGFTLQTEPVVVTATRFAASIDTAPVNVTIITTEDIARSNSTTLSDVLNMQAGVNISNLFGISGSKAKVDMGGFGGNGGQNTLILLNGRRLNDVDLQGANLASIPLDSIAQIEIINGSGTVLYGDNAVGGVINIVTKNGFDGEHRSIKIQAGSFQTQRLSGEFRTANNDTAQSLAFDGLDSNGFRDNSAFNSFSLMGEISHESDNNNYGTRISASREKLQLPGALNETVFNSNPTAAVGTLEHAKEKRYSIEGFYVSSNLSAELSFSKKHQEASIFGDTVADLSTLSFTPRSNRQYGNHNLITGIDLYRSRLDAKATFTNSNTSNTTRDSYALYITDTINFGSDTTLNIGARHQFVKLNMENTHSVNGSSSDGRTDHTNAADITLSHKARYGGRNYVRLARSFRSPVLDEMWSYFFGSITLLKPQTADHLEIGTRQEFKNGIRLSANLFHMNLNNEIAYNGTANVNLDDTRHDGFNLSLVTEVTPQLSINTGYAFRKASFTGGSSSGKAIPEIPRHKITLSGQYQLSNDRQLGLTAVYKGKRYFGNDFSNAGKQMPAYTQLDVSYSQQISNWKLSALIKNLTNENSADSGYYNTFVTPPYTYYPLPERAIYFTLKGEL